MNNSGITGKEILQFNNRIFKYLEGNSVFNGNEHEKQLRALRAIGMFASSFHPGRYNSAFCNKIINKIASEIKETATPVLPKKGTVLFIASSLHAVGGHTRLMENIAAFEKEKGKQLVLVITDQLDAEVPDRIVKGDLFERIICYGKLTRLQCIVELRKIFQQAEKIYNNQDPYDAVPPVALAAKNRPATIYINHADHTFWFGAQQADLVLHIRPYGEQLARQRRTSAAQHVILPIRLNLLDNNISKNEARKRLGIKGDAKMFLCISSYYKVVPNATHNLFEVIDDILELDNENVFVLVGVNEEEYRILTKKEPPSNLILAGIVEEPGLYKAAADLYIEGMPLSSFTALLEGVYAGAYPFLMWDPYYSTVRIEEDLCLQGLVSHPGNRSDYLEGIKRAVQGGDSQSREQVVNEIRSRIRYYSSAEYWENELQVSQLDAAKATDSFLEFSDGIDDCRLAELLHFSKTERTVIEVAILRIMYRSMSYAEYFSLALLLYKLKRRTIIFPVFFQQLGKKIIKQLFPSTVAGYLAKTRY